MRFGEDGHGGVEAGKGDEAVGWLTEDGLEAKKDEKRMNGKNHNDGTETKPVHQLICQRLVVKNHSTNGGLRTWIYEMLVYCSLYVVNHCRGYDVVLPCPAVVGANRMTPSQY